jgi:flagellar biosynthesis/type III secretory pathway chaperone
MHETMSETQDTDRLAALIEGKLQALAVLCRLAEQQLALVEAGETTSLLKLLAAKQNVLGQLQRIERDLDPFRAEDPETRRWRRPEDRARCQQQADECARLLAAAIQFEKQSESHMVRRRDEAAARLQGIHSAALASRAYAGHVAAAAARSTLHEEG